jgi:hypothetical protein
MINQIEHMTKKTKQMTAPNQLKGDLEPSARRWFSRSPLCGTRTFSLNKPAGEQSNEKYS